MSSPPSYTPCAEPRLGSGDWNRAESARHDPGQNLLLAALPAADYERLLPGLEPVFLPPGWTIHGAGDREDHLYFLTAGIVARFHVTESGASSEFAVTGNEGVIGVASFLGGGSTLSQAVVLCAGYAYRLRADVLNSELDHRGPLPQVLLRYTLALIRQTAQTAACNRHHSLEQRLCRWLLSCLDRLPSNEMRMTQELIADMLGVRRVGVTEAAGRLQQAGIIRYSRGHIAVLDRPGLETHACECYAVVKREYDRLLRPQCVVRNARVHGTYGIALGAAV
jgi:CRP-like cAMP-binding protein